MKINSTNDVFTRQSEVSDSDSGSEQLPIAVPVPSELKQKSVRGGAATILSQCVSMAVQIGTTFVLARLLLPTDYGLQSMVLTLTSFFSLFKDAGLSVATVQRETLTRDQISTLFWLNAVVGTLLAVLVAAAAPLLASFYRDPRLFWLTIASASIFFFNGLSVQHRALLDRSMRFGTNAKIDIFCSLGSAVVAVSMAALGCGYWSLICQNISLSLLGTIAVWVLMPWMPGRPRWTPELRSLVGFGGTVTLNSVVVYIAYNAEKVLLGRFWGTAPLGLYGRAYQLATLPIQQMIGAIHTVAFSTLSRMQGELERLQNAYLKSLSLIVSMTIPVVITTALFADEIVRVVLGTRWLEVIPVLRLLSPTALVLALINPFSWLLRATGRVRRSLNIAFLICPVVILGILAGLRYGPSGVATGYSLAMVALFAPVVAWAMHGTGITARIYFNAIKRPLFSGFVGGLAGWFIRQQCLGIFTPLPLLILELSISCLIYGTVLLFVLGEKTFYLDIARQLLPRKKAEVANA